MKKTQMFRRIIILLIGVMFMGLGASYMTVTGIGGDAILVFQQGFANTLKLELGQAITILNVLLIIVLFFVNKKMIYIGTVVVVLLAGTWVDIVLKLNIFPTSDLMLLKLLNFLIASLIVTFGVSLYLYADIGFAPFEGVIITIKNNTKIRFAYIKIVHDAILFLVGWLLGGIFGIGSIISIFLFGPLIDFYTYFLKKTKLVKTTI